ncbi:MAG: biotin--[acetyl-CoA-carboxylase] ligase [Rhodobacteraceae bacterium]|nr:biotin--[acetyl-CoA-carboxylase] ligase [Paracoccaceae bacterium]
MLASVDSTNAEGFRRALHLSGPLWILAEVQTAGRGRRARPWVSPPGNFHATLVQRLPGAPAEAALRSYVAALALFDTVEALTGAGAALALKWPNDLLLNGGKVSGILLEATGDLLCIGIGVNLIAAPPPEAVEPGAVPPVSVLAETGVRLTPPAFLDALAAAMAGREAQFRSGGFPALRADWLARAARLGQTIRARTGAETREGVFETVDDSGNLILRTAAGRVVLPAADVFF